MVQEIFKSLKPSYYSEFIIALQQKIFLSSMLVADKSFLESEKYYPKLLDKCKL